MCNIEKAILRYFSYVLFLVCSIPITLIYYFIILSVFIIRNNKTFQVDNQLSESQVRL